jgi:Tol biopolymer transport system component
MVARRPNLRRPLAIGLALAATISACGGTPTSSGSSSQPSPAQVRSASSGPLLPNAAPIPGRIAYNTGDGEIWVMNGDGTDAHRVTSRGGNNFDPKWTADGRSIVFRTNRGAYAPDPEGTGTEGIFVVDVASGHERQLYPPDAATVGGLFAAPSPDGRVVALSTVDVIGGAREEVIIIVDFRSGKRLRTIRVHGGECSTWSPDGSQIAYCHLNGTFEVRIMRADGTTQRRMSPSANTGAYPGPWSPDGRQLLFSAYGAGGGRHVYVIEADGRHARQLTFSEGAQAAEAWLPDGRIVFQSQAPDADRPSWFVVRSDGSGVARVPAFDDAHVLEGIAWHA